LRKCCAKPYNTWYLDAVYLKIVGRMVDLRRAVDEEGEVLDVPVPVQAEQARRAETDAQASQEIRLRSRSNDHRRLALLSEFATAMKVVRSAKSPALHC
jgi:hypothetical protein